jgi:hypothetical protein
VKPDDLLQLRLTEFLFQLNTIRKAGVTLAVGLLDALSFGVNYYLPISRDDK